MNKQEFLEQLRKGLSGLPREDLEERLSFYGEMIDDRVEEGLTEEEAVSQLGSVEEVVAQILAETPLTKLVKEKVRPKRRLETWELVLLIAGIPVWGSLLIAVLSVAFSVYCSVWAVIISLWASAVAVAATAIGGLLASVVLLCRWLPLPGLALMGAAIVCAGLSILMFFGCALVSKGTVFLTKQMILGIKTLIVGKGETA